MSASRVGKLYGERVERINLNCITCGKITKSLIHQVMRGRGKFCSKNCYSDWLSKTRKGENHWNWQDGKTATHLLERGTREYREWRQAVFERDNYTCILCKRKKEVSGKLNADHINPFAFFPELRLEISNGRTLCEECHRKTDNYAGKGYKRLIYNIKNI